jgi:hypothetical protein
LDDAEGTKSKVPPQYREKTGEESSWPADLREHEDENLANNQEAVQYRPEYSGRLVGHGRSTGVAASEKTLIYIHIIRARCNRN